MLHPENKTSKNIVCVINKDTGSKFNTHVHSCEEINQNNYPMNLNNSQETPIKEANEEENAINILKHHGYQPKVFCYSQKNDFKTAFKVESDKVVWNVQPLEIEVISDIPQELLEAIGILSRYNVQIRSIALASPQPVEQKQGVLIQEFSKECHTVFNAMQVPLIIFSTLVKQFSKRDSSIRVSSNTSSNISATLVDLPDPVLLVRLTHTWLEIGRW